MFGVSDYSFSNLLISFLFFKFGNLVVIRLIYKIIIKRLISYVIVLIFVMMVDNNFWCLGIGESNGNKLCW